MKVINPPKPITREAYDAALSQYVERAKKTPGVHAILTMGNVGAPGLSDLDVLVVVEDDFQPQYASNLATSNINNDIFIHGAVIIPTSMVDDLPHIIYANDLTTIYGAPVITKFDTLPSQKSRILSMAYLIDFTESRLIQCARVVDAGVVDQRSWMTRLWSLTHSEHLCNHANLTLSPQARQVLENIKTLRRSWISESVVDTAIFEDAFTHLATTNKEIFTLALHRLYEGEVTVQPPDVSVGEKRVSFLSHVQGCEHIRYTIRVGKRKTEHYRIFAHPKYACHLSNYGFVTILACDKFINPVLKQRATIVKKHWVWLRHHCPGVNAMSGYLGLRPYRGNTWVNYVKRGIWALYDLMNKPEFAHD